MLEYFRYPAETAKWPGASLYHYLVDRISGTNQIQPLDDLVLLRANDLNLDGPSH